MKYNLKIVKSIQDAIQRGDRAEVQRICKEQQELASKKPYKKKPTSKLKSKK